MGEKKSGRKVEWQRATPEGVGEKKRSREQRWRG